MVLRTNAVKWAALASVWLIGCAGSAGDPVGGAEMNVPERDSGPAGAEFLGKVDTLGKLPPDRLVAIMNDGTAYLLPTSAVDYSKAVGSPRGLPPGEEEIPDAEPPARTPRLPALEQSAGEVGKVSQALLPSSYAIGGIIGDDNRFPVYSTTVGGISTNQRRVVDLKTDPVCTGSFIGPRQVLTDAHCVYIRSIGWGQPSYVVPAQQGICLSSNWVCNSGLVTEPFGRLDRYTTIVPSNWINTGGDQYDQAVVIIQDYASWGYWFSSSFGVAPYPPAAPTHQGYPSRSLPCVNSPDTTNSSGYSAPWNKLCLGLQYKDYGGYVASHDSNFVWGVYDSQSGESGSPLVYSTTVYGTLLGRQSDYAAFKRVMSSLVCDALARFPSTVMGNPGCY